MNHCEGRGGTGRSFDGECPVDSALDSRTCDRRTCRASRIPVLEAGASHRSLHTAPLGFAQPALQDRLVVLPGVDARTRRLRAHTPSFGSTPGRLDSSLSADQHQFRRSTSAVPGIWRLLALAHSCCNHAARPDGSRPNRGRLGCAVDHGIAQRTRLIASLASALLSVLAGGSGHCCAVAAHRGSLPHSLYRAGPQLCHVPVRLLHRF